MKHRFYEQQDQTETNISMTNQEYLNLYVGNKISRLTPKFNFENFYDGSCLSFEIVWNLIQIDFQCFEKLQFADHRSLVIWDDIMSL